MRAMVLEKTGPIESSPLQLREVPDPSPANCEVRVRVSCCAIPDSFDDVHASPLLCAGIIGYRAMLRSGVRDGEKLAIFGFGSSAHVVLQIARRRGCEVYVVSRGASHRKLASDLGATWTGD